MGASASQPWHHPTSKAPNQPVTAPVPVPFLPHPHPSPCLVLRRAAHVVGRGGGGRKSSRIAKSPPTIFLSRARKQQAPKSACMTLPVRRLDTSVAHVVYRRHHSQLTTTTHR